MKSTLRNIIAAAAVAAAGLGAAASAGAHEYDGWAQRRYEPPAPVYVVPARPAPVYAVGHYESRRHGCRVEHWNPNVRYMPGDAVRRHGELYVARGISAHAWNVNSPPEWTPRYWAPARCD